MAMRGRKSDVVDPETIGPVIKTRPLLAQKGRCRNEKKDLRGRARPQIFHDSFDGGGGGGGGAPTGEAVR